MQTYDLVMLVILCGAAFFGFIKGFAWQVASLASLLLSYMFALRFADALAPQLNADPRWSKYLAMLLIYCGTSFFVWMGFRVVSGTIDKIKLREFDRQIGGLFGLFKGALLCTIVTFFAVTLTESSRAAVLHSKSGEHISRFLHEAQVVMPPELHKFLDPYIARLNQGLDPTQEVEHPALPNAGSLPMNIPSMNLQNPMMPQQYMPQPYQQQYQPPGYDPRQFQYPPYQQSPVQPQAPSAYPPGYDYQSGQYYVPQNR